MLVDRFLQSELKAELEPDEEALWVGKPDPKRAAIQCLGICGLGVVLLAFMASFIEGWYSFPHKDVSGLGGLFGMNGILSSLFFVPFVLIPMGMLLSPLWAYLHSRHTLYAVTNQRIVIFQSKWPRKIQSFGKSDLTSVERRERPDGSGDLTFAQKLCKDSEGSGRTQDVKFLGIPEVKAVEKLLRETATRWK